MIDPNYISTKAQEDENKRIIERDRFIALKKLHDEQTAEYLKHKHDLEQTEIDLQNEINDLLLTKASLEHEKELLEIENQEIKIESSQLDDLLARLIEESGYESKELEDSVYFLKLNADKSAQNFNKEIDELKAGLLSRLADKSKEYTNYIENLTSKRSELQKGIIALDNEIIKTESAILDKKIKRMILYSFLQVIDLK